MKWMNPWKDQAISTFLHKLEPQFYNLDYKSTDSLRRMKCKLHDFAEQVPPKYSKFINSVTFNINRHLEHRAEYQGRHDHRKHRMSDHAFVRVVELIHGLDIDELKDQAIKDVEQSDRYEALCKDGRIVTILQKGENDDTRRIQSVV